MTKAFSKSDLMKIAIEEHLKCKVYPNLVKMNNGWSFKSAKSRGT